MPTSRWQQDRAPSEGSGGSPLASSRLPAVAGSLGTLQLAAASLQLLLYRMAVFCLCVCQSLCPSLLLLSLIKTPITGLGSTLIYYCVLTLTRLYLQRLSK